MSNNGKENWAGQLKIVVIVVFIVLVISAAFGGIADWLSSMSGFGQLVVFILFFVVIGWLFIDNKNGKSN